MLIETIVIASRNPAKVGYYRTIFTKVAGKVLGLTDLDVEGKPTEIGETAEENAEIKAKFYTQKTSSPVFCEDEALYADFLLPDKQPGTRVRRINGVDEVSDDQLITYWEEIVSKIPKDKRTGYWHIAYCLAFPNGRVKTTAVDQKVSFFYPSSKVRIPGWPMSSLEGNLGKPNSERTEEELRLSKKQTGKVILEKLKELLTEIT